MTTKKVVLTLGGKSGTGKTLVCRTLFHLHKGENVHVLSKPKSNPSKLDCSNGLNDGLYSLGTVLPQFAVLTKAGEVPTPQNQVV